MALCDALELEDPIFMGSSFGGNIALQLAADRPGLVHGLALVDGGGCTWVTSSPTSMRRSRCWRRLGSMA